MNLQDTKQELVDGMVAAGLPAVGYTPETITAPKVIIECGDPYIEEFEGTLNEKAFTYKVNLTITCVAQSSTVNVSKTKQIDEMITTVIDNLGDWDFNGCEQPRSYLVNNKYAYIAIIDVSHEFEIE